MKCLFVDKSQGYCRESFIASVGEQPEIMQRIGCVFGKIGWPDWATGPINPRKQKGQLCGLTVAGHRAYRNLV